MKYVTTMGAVWKMSDRNFRKLAKELKASGGTVESLDAYGKMIIDRTFKFDEIVGEAFGWEEED